MFYTLQGELFGMGPVQNRTDDDRNAALIRMSAAILNLYLDDNNFIHLGMQ
jgi:hypothetical protein